MTKKADENIETQKIRSIEIQKGKNEIGKQFFWATLGLSILLLSFGFIVSLSFLTTDNMYGNDKLDKVLLYDLIKTSLQSDEIVFEGDCGTKLLGNSTSLTTVDVDCKFTRIKIGKVSE